MSRGASMYFRDRWNVLDVSILLFLAAGLISSLGSGSNQWSHAFYAVSAPLFYARLLFFTQVLRMPGPMIEVILSMTMELARFGTVMAVVMIGFAVSFHALFRNDDSFGVTLLDLFKAMLGEVDFFDDFSGGRGDAVATVLLVAYLLIMAIMLLNLLVAILSTSHAKVQGNVEREFRVSKAHIIQQYRLVVEEHLLPAPFNLLQLVLSCVLAVVSCRCTRGGYIRAKEATGRLVFWLVLGPLAVAAGGLLWMTSMFTFTFVWCKYYSEQMNSLVLSAKHRDDLPGRATLLSGQNKGWPWTWFMVVTHLIFGLWCLVGAPLCLVALWLTNTLKCAQALIRVCFRRLRADSDATQSTPPDESSGLDRRADGGPSDREDLCSSDRARVSSSDRAGATAADGTTDFTIQAMLKRGAGGIGVDELRKFLKNPISDPEVREDEKRRGVTVEHLKLFRNRVERTLRESRAANKFNLEKLAVKHANNERERAELNNKLGSVLRALSAKNERLEHLEKECNKSKQDRLEIKSMLDTVLMALGSMQPKPTAICSGSNTNKAGAPAPLS